MNATHVSKKTTALDMARIYGHHAIVSYLEKLGALSNDKYVCELRYLLAMEILKDVCRSGTFYEKHGFLNIEECFDAISQGDVNEVVDDYSEETLLHIAAGQNQYESGPKRKLIEQLLALGVDPELKDREGNRAIDIVKQSFCIESELARQEAFLIHKILLEYIRK